MDSVRSGRRDSRNRLANGEGSASHRSSVEALTSTSAETVCHLALEKPLSPIPTPLNRHLAVVRPEIAKVLESASGIERSVVELLGYDYERLMQLRMDVKSSIQEGRPAYLCAECFTPVYVCRRKETQRFFFRHKIEDGRCSAITRGELSQDEIKARKYNGAKESWLHLQMKRWLVDSLSASGQFSDIQEEKRWTGRIMGEWRKPDVVATFNGLKIAFEVQLSTTFLDVIAARRLFYLKEGGLLFWIFAAFEEKARRLTLDDVFYNNNQNAFIVSQQTRDASVQARDFLLDCVSTKPPSGQFEGLLLRDRVSFRDLTLDIKKQQAYFFDYATAVSQQTVYDAARRAGWSREFEYWFLKIAADHSSQYDQEDALATFPDDIPVHWGDGEIITDTPLRFYDHERRLPVAMLNAIYSAKQGRPVGLNRKQFIEVAHYVATSHPRYLLWFRKALQVYGRASLLKEQDRSGNWAKRVRTYRKEMQEDPDRYAADQSHQLLFEFLFPELMPLPLWPEGVNAG